MLCTMQRILRIASSEGVLIYGYYHPYNKIQLELATLHHHKLHSTTHHIQYSLRNQRNQFPLNMTS